MKRIVEKAIPSSGVTQQSILSWLRDTIVPVVREIRSVFNSRFGEVTTITSDYTITNIDEVIIADTDGGVITVTLPPVIGWTKHIIVKRFGSFSVTIQPDTDDAANGVTVDGAASATLTANHRALTFVTDGSTWYYVNYI